MLKPHLKEQWTSASSVEPYIPPGSDCEFVAAMEDVLEVYRRPYDVRRPQVCIDELSKQLVGEVQDPVPMGPGQVRRYDCEYVRNGMANLFVASEPLAGWRHMEVTDRRTRADFAHFVRDLVDGRYRDAEKVVLDFGELSRAVMDNLNTHTAASLYEAFAPEEARRIAEKRNGLIAADPLEPRHRAVRHRRGNEG